MPVIDMERIIVRETVRSSAVVLTVEGRVNRRLKRLWMLLVESIPTLGFLSERENYA